MTIAAKDTNQLSLSAWSHSKDLLKFSVPMTLTAASAVLTQIIDSLMAGKLGIGHLAGIALASSTYFMAVIIGRGVSQGLSPLLAGTAARGDQVASEKLISHSLLLQIIVGIVLTPFLYLVNHSLEFFGQAEDVATYARTYLNIMGIFLIPQFIMQVLRTCIESYGNSKFPMMASYGAAALNIFLNWLLIFGNLGFPRMELAGAALASGLSHTFLLVIFYMYLKNKYSIHPLAGFKDGFDKSSFSKLSKLGGIFAFQWFIEVGAFSGSTVIIALYSKTHLAAHQIVLNVATLMFMIPLGLGAASTIKVSGAVSKYGKDKILPIVKSYLLTCWVATIFTSILILICKDIVPSFYTNDLAVISLAQSVLLIAALFQFADGTQAVVSGILRGYMDIKTPTIVITVCWWFITLPLGYFLSIQLQKGTQGMWYALTLGLFLAAALLTARLYKVAVKKVKV